MIIPFHKNEFAKLMKFLNFREVSFDEYPELFGDFEYYFENRETKIRLVRYRDIENIDFQNKSDPSTWFDFQIIYCLLEKKIDMTDSFNIELQLAYLEKNHLQILSIFNAKNYCNTKIELEKLKNDRARQMFPGSFAEIKKFY